MRLRLTVAFVLLAFLTGCASIPVRSLVALSRIDFRTTDLREMRVALEMPEGIRPRKDGVRMDATVKIDGEPDQTPDFRLVEAEEDSALPADPGQGLKRRLFRLSDEDLGRLDGIRKMINAARSSGRKGTLAVGIAAKEFCRTPAFGAGPLPVTTYLKTSETGRFVLVTDRLDLRSDPRIAASFDSLPRC